MKSRASVVVVSLLGLVAAACSSVPYSNRKQLNLVPAGQLSEMGTMAFAQLVQQVPISQEAEVNAYVACVTEPIIETFRERHGGEQQWKLAVIQDPTPNAFVMPGGNIGVHAGLLKVAKTDEQLAAVMGHELGHELANHAGERMSQQLLAQGGLTAANAFIAGRASSGVQRAALAALGLGAQVGLLLPFSRNQESEADVIGLQLMAASGFDPRPSVELWGNMKAASGGEGPPTFLSTHPNPDQRIEELKGKMPDALATFAQAGEGRRQVLASRANARRSAPEVATGPRRGQQAGTIPAASAKCTRPSDAQIERASGPARQVNAR